MYPRAARSLGSLPFRGQVEYGTCPKVNVPYVRAQAPATARADDTTVD